MAPVKERDYPVGSWSKTTKLILLDSLLQEVVVTLPHLCVADNMPEATAINTDAMPYRSAVE
jgi:hypothetical protein